MRWNKDGSTPQKPTDNPLQFWASLSHLLIA